MTWVIVWMALGLVTGLWLCWRVSRSSVSLAVATFLLGPIGAAYTLVKERGRPATSVTVPFLANLACVSMLLVSGWSLLVGLMQGAPDEPDAAVLAAADDAAPLTMEVAFSSASPAAVRPAAKPADPIDALAGDLRRVGVQATVLRLPSTAQLPQGVVAGAQFAMSAAPGAGGWIQDRPVAASAAVDAADDDEGGAAAAESMQIAALFLRCDAAATCRSVARSYQAQDPATRPRVLQNGAMLLLMSDLGSASSGALHNVVAGTFRRLSTP